MDFLGEILGKVHVTSQSLGVLHDSLTTIGVALVKKKMGWEFYIKCYDEMLDWGERKGT